MKTINFTILACSFASITSVSQDCKSYSKGT